MKTYIKLLIAFLLLHTSIIAKKSSKIDKLLKKSGYEDTIVFYYGSKANHRQYDTFLAFLKHFKLKSKELYDCNDGLKGKQCYNQVKKEVWSQHYSTVIVLVNYDTNLINGMNLKFIQAMKNSHQPLLASRNIDKFGINLIGSPVQLKEILDSLILEENLDVLEPFFEQNEDTFTNVDKWNHSQISVFVNEMRHSVKYHYFDEPERNPSVLQTENFEITDHLMNLISTNVEISDLIMEAPRPNDSHPLIFVILAISEPVLFAEEFLRGFLEQDYPKQNMILCISTKSNYSADISKKLQEEEFLKVMTTDSTQDYVQQRIEAIEKFETTNAEYILFLNNSVILSNANILSTLVKHNQAVIAPMIRMNLFRPSYRNIFKYGYNESSDITELFPNTEKFRKTWRHDRYYRGSNYVLYETQKMRNTTNYGTDLNFWAPQVLCSQEYKKHHSTNSNQQNIPHLLDFKDLGSQHEQNHITSLMDNSFAKVAKVLRAESFRYIYLVKNTALRRLDTEVLKKAKNLDDADYLISQGLKDGAPLMLLTGETSGELVNYQIVKNQHQINYKSIHRILENFHLWTNRYIQPKILSYVKQNDTNSLQEFPSLLNSTKCPDVYILKTLFSHQFFEEFKSLVISEFERKPSYTQSINLRDIGFSEDWLSIISFFIQPWLHRYFNGVYIDFPEGDFMIRKYSFSDNTDFKLDIVHSDHYLNFLVPLSSAGEITFERYKCTIPLEEETVLIFPGEITHYHNIKSKSANDTIVFSSTIQKAMWCNEIVGQIECQGFESDSRYDELEVMLNQRIEPHDDGSIDIEDIFGS